MGIKTERSNNNTESYERKIKANSPKLSCRLIFLIGKKKMRKIPTTYVNEKLFTFDML